MRITIKIDSATEEELRALQQAVYAAEPNGRLPTIPGHDVHSPSAIMAWVCGSAWSGSTPPMASSAGVEMLRQLADRLEPTEVKS